MDITSKTLFYISQKTTYERVGTMDLPSAEEKVKPQGSSSASFVFTLLIITLETIISLPTIGLATQQVISFGNKAGAAYLVPTDLYAVLYFLFPIVFCAFFSSILNPKRILSPFYVNLGTIALVGIMVAAKINVMVSEPSWQMSLNIFTSVLFFGVILIIAGIGQTEVVKLIVGLNLISVDCLSYSLNEDFEKLREHLKDIKFGDFLKFSYFKRVPDETTGTRIYKRSLQSGESLVLAIGSDSTSEGNTIVATVAYRKGYYGIVATDSASYSRTSLVNDLFSRLQKVNPSIAFAIIGKPNDKVSSRAYIEAIKPTQPKLESIKDSFLKLHWIYQISILATIVLFVGLTVAYLAQALEFSVYATAAIPTFFTLLIELGLAAREELTRRKLEDEWD